MSKAFLLRRHFSAHGPAQTKQSQPRQTQEESRQQYPQLTSALLVSLIAQRFEAGVAVVDAVDPRAAGRADDDAATHADADAGTIRVKMAGSHQDSMMENAKTLQGGFQFAANLGEASLRRIGADDIHGTDVAPAMETDQKKPRFACTAHFDF